MTRRSTSNITVPTLEIGGKEFNIGVFVGLTLGYSSISQGLINQARLVRSGEGRVERRIFAIVNPFLKVIFI